MAKATQRKERQVHFTWLHSEMDFTTRSILWTVYQYTSPPFREIHLLTLSSQVLLRRDPLVDSSLETKNIDVEYREDSPGSIDSPVRNPWSAKGNG